MTDSTSVYLPAKLPYPLKVSKVIVEEGDVISKHAQIFTYKYSDYEPVPLSKEDDDDDRETGDMADSDEGARKKVKVEYVGNYECPFGGRIEKVYIKTGDVLNNEAGHILDVVEPCTHPIQYGGLCAICGKSVDDEDRASIPMAHGTTNLKVSSKEAANIERGSTKRLLKEKKLSLVVDLDQTVIHATVDPTVGEWMSDPTNPNYEALKDVKSFSLEEPAMVSSGYTGPISPANIRWYFVKLRPGLHDFLEKASKMYEMHIYTMATRSYAKEIGKIIDPDGIYFGDRILSRDESGSLTQKSLKRLFPVDTSMVVVIDDRGDVWNWSPNLIKVIPYDFFVGIGDINSSFLPRQQALLGPSKRRKSVNILEEKLTDGEEKDESSRETISDIRINIKEMAKQIGKDESAIEDEYESTTDGDIKVEDESTRKIGEEVEKAAASAVDSSVNVSVTDRASSPVDRMVELGEGELLAMQANERSSALEQQQQERPLAKMQQNLEKIIEEEETKNSSVRESPILGMDGKEPHNLLYDDDNELEMLGQALMRIHNEFYFEVEREDQTQHAPDVEDIMTSMKSLVFRGFVFLLSGVLPLGTPLDSADIVIWAKSFGATFSAEYNTSVTHVICKNPGTFKVRLAKSVDSKVKIVNPNWLFSCMSLWEKVPEEEYEVEVEHLLSKEQVDNFLKYHNHVLGETTFDTSNLDWNEIDEEMKEFMGDDYEAEEGEGEADHAGTKEAEGAAAKEVEVSGADDDADDGDDFEQEILEDLADLEEENKDKH
ncbi:hypothetical protein FOA43_000850 [Brettanomyces nanus]|uniref:RNA polymerase II subunit A C-terminal domain phosphatase n=1 Tax=Eeniella nana TaxID=13502 RepID=A0A875S0Z8_EENNA|nr:uncharacterized protein FOA43_000850 [Brettanomyces nanus]QPG73539.1 hypothetical protein FOA43_000850 [Brettanomyces nanus]